MILLSLLGPKHFQSCNQVQELLVFSDPFSGLGEKLYIQHYENELQAWA